MRKRAGLVFLADSARIPDKAVFVQDLASPGRRNRRTSAAGTGMAQASPPFLPCVSPCTGASGYRYSPDGPAFYSGKEPPTPFPLSGAIPAQKNTRTENVRVLILLQKTPLSGWGTQPFGSFTSGISSRLTICSISSSLAHSSGVNRREIRCMTSTI